MTVVRTVLLLERTPKLKILLMIGVKSLKAVLVVGTCSTESMKVYGPKDMQKFSGDERRKVNALPVAGGVLYHKYL